MPLTGLKRFKLGKVLGSGSFATVCVATDMNDDKKYAMKVIDKAKCKGQEKHIVLEVGIMKKVDHPNIIKLYDVFETKEKIYLQLQMVTGGELFDRIVSKGFYTEKDAKRVVVDVMSALKYLHDMNIVHRDLKPENLLLLDTSDASPVQVADFGLAKVLPSNALLETSCGTLTYVAPEVLNGKQYEGKPTDMWSMGVITYILLSGYPPFHSDNDAKILEQTLSGKFQYFSPEWDSVSKNAKDFINNLIVVDHKVRMTVDQVLAHPWLDSEIKRREGKTVTDEENISLPQVGANLKKNFNARKKMTSLIQAVSFMTKLQLKDGFKLDSRLNSQNGSQDGSKPETPKGDFDPTKEQKLKDIEAVKARLDQIAENQASKQEKI